MEWSYRLLDERERRVFRAVSVFPAGFTLEAAEAVAGPGAGPVVLRLVDCSLLVPPRAGPDGRSRYVMLETLRAYGAGLLAEAGEQDGGRRGAGRVRAAGGRGRPRPGCSPVTVSWPRPAGWTPRTPPCGRCWPGRWRTIRPWRCGWPTRWAGGGSCGAGWPVSTRCCARPPARAEAGSDGWCAAQLWLGWAAQFSADLAAALGHFTAVRDAVADRPPSRALAAALAGRAAVLRLMGRTAEAAGDARRALALARQIGDPAGELLALADLSFDADYAGDHDEAVRLARQAGQITAGIPGGLARMCSYVLTIVLADAGDLAEAERVGAAGLARARDAGDLWNQAALLPRIVDLDLRAGRTGDAAAHLREGLQPRGADRQLA